jgi:hypothetical protein
MKKNLLFPILLMVVFVQISFGQQTAMTNTTKDALNNLSGSQKITANSVLYGVPTPPSELVGDFFYDSTFVDSKIALVGDKQVYESTARFDIKNDVVEIKTKDGNRWVDGSKISFFTLATKTSPNPVLFMNVKNFKSGEEKLSGFFEVLQDGKVLLFQHTKVKIRKPTYSPALGTGDLNSKVIKESEYYCAVDGKIQKVTTSKKGIMALFGDKKDEISKFLSTNDVDLKSRGGLANLFNYYNTIK